MAQDAPRSGRPFEAWRENAAPPANTSPTRARLFIASGVDRSHNRCPPWQVARQHRAIGHVNRHAERAGPAHGASLQPPGAYSAGRCERPVSPPSIWLHCRRRCRRRRCRRLLPPPAAQRLALTGGATSLPPAPFLLQQDVPLLTVPQEPLQRVLPSGGGAGAAAPRRWHPARLCRPPAAAAAAPATAAAAALVQHSKHGRSGQPVEPRCRCAPPC